MNLSAVTYTRNYPLGLLDTSHLRGVQDECGSTLYLLTEAVRIQHLGRYVRYKCI